MMLTKNFRRGLTALLTGTMIIGGSAAAVPSAVSAQGTAEVIALDDLNVSVELPGYAGIEEDAEDGMVYIYTKEAGSIPYVLVGQYKYSGTVSQFGDLFTSYMQDNYGDLDVDELQEGVELGGKSLERIVYRYSVSGYEAKDTRYFCSLLGRIYMVGAKEIPEIAYEVGSGFLEGAAASLAPLAGGYGDYEKHVDSEHSLEGTPYTAPAPTAAATPAPSSSGKTPDIQFTESMADYEGTWVPFADGFKIYLPSDWDEFSVSNAMSQQGILYLAGEESQSADAPNIKVAYSEAGGVKTPDELAAALKQAGYSVDRVYNINGFDCVLYGSAEQNISGLMFFHPLTTDYVFAVVGAPADQNAALLAKILISLSPN